MEHCRGPLLFRPAGRINVGVRHLAGRRVKANLPYSRVFCSAAPQFLFAAKGVMTTARRARAYQAQRNRHDLQRLGISVTGATRDRSQR
jgi:hypothetical protein